MALSRVQRSRFLECLNDLFELIDLAYKTIGVEWNDEDNPQALKDLVVKKLKKSVGAGYQSFDLSTTGLILKLRVDCSGRIKGFVQLDEDLTTENLSQMRLNNFIFSSTLRDEAVEYDLW